MPVTEEATNELNDRQRTSARIVSVLITITLIVTALAIAHLYPNVRANDLTLSMALRIAILFCGLGAVALRRARFNFTRLRDVMGLGGTSGLVASLQKTTLLVAALAVAIALMGYIITAQTGNILDTLLPSTAALAILLFTYPRRGAWQRIVQLIKESNAGTN